MSDKTQPKNKKTGRLPKAVTITVIVILALLLAALLTLCAVIFSQENQTGFLPIMRISKNGRVKTAAAKILAALIMTLAVVMSFTLSGFAVYGLRIGFSGNNALQSLETFTLSPYRISIFGYLAASFGIKLLAFSVFSLTVLALSAAYALRRRAVPTWGAAGRKSQGGGPLMDIGSHAIDLALWLSGCFAPEYAVGTAYDRIGRTGSAANHWGSWNPEAYEVEDLAVGLVRMKNGMTLSIEASYALNVVEEKEASVDLFGTAAGLELRQTDGVAIVQELGDRMVVSRTDIQHTLRGLTPGEVPKSPSQREHDAVIAMLLNGATVDPTAEQALAVARIVDGIYRSASAGCGFMRQTRSSMRRFVPSGSIR